MKSSCLQSTFTYRVHNTSIVDKDIKASISFHQKVFEGHHTDHVRDVELMKLRWEPLLLQCFHAVLPTFLVPCSHEHIAVPLLTQATNYGETDALVRPRHLNRIPWCIKVWQGSDQNRASGTQTGLMSRYQTWDEVTKQIRHLPT